MHTKGSRDTVACTYVCAWNVSVVQLQLVTVYISSTSVQLVVSLMDENDNTPQFTLLPGDMPVVPENALVGRIVAVVGASDADQGSNAELTYTITGGSGQGKPTQLYSCRMDGMRLFIKMFHCVINVIDSFNSRPV